VKVELVGTILEGDEIERVDALARERGVSREEMVVVVFYSGLVELEDREPVSRARPKAGAS
jgi:hypothetical protein